MAEFGLLNFPTLSGRVAESGIRVRLRSVSRKGWEFESPHAHLAQDGVLRMLETLYVAAPYTLVPPLCGLKI